MGRPGAVLLFLYIDTYFRIQGLFIKHNHIISNLCSQNIFSMTKFIFATKAETYFWIWMRKIGGAFNWFCSRDQLVKLGFQYEDIFVRESVNRRERFGICFKEPESLYLYNPRCTGSWSMELSVNIFMYSCWPALLHLLHHGTIGLWWRSSIYIIDNSSHSTAVCTLPIVMLNTSYTDSSSVS